MSDGSKSEAFNLLDRAWIRCHLLDGTEKLLSVSDVLTRAREVRRIAGDTPQQDLAVLRLLLVVVWRAHRDDPRLQGFNADSADDWWLDLFTGDADLEHQKRLTAYLESVHDRWDLLDPQQPFMQVGDLETSRGTHDSIRKLVPDAESDYFSVRAGPGLERISYAEAARWLVHLQAWNYSGIKSGVLGDPRVKGGKSYPIGAGWSGKSGGVVLHGRDLGETIALNSPVDPVFTQYKAAQDLPAWERPPGTAVPRATLVPDGPCDLLTWQSRRVRLFWDGDGVTGVLVGNGDRLELKNNFRDPMTAYRFSKNQSSAGQVVRMPKPHDVSRTLWRGIEPLLMREGMGEGPQETRDFPPATVTWLHQMRELDVGSGDLDLSFHVDVELVGMTYGTQDATITGTVHEELPLRLSVLVQRDDATAQAIISAAEATMGAAVSLGQFSGRLAQAGGREYAFAPDVTEAVLASMNEPFKDWLRAFDPSEPVDHQRERWFWHAEQAVLEHARVLVTGAGPLALIGRQDQDGRFRSAATAWDGLIHSLNLAFGRRTSVAPATSPSSDLMEVTP